MTPSAPDPQKPSFPSTPGTSAVPAPKNPPVAPSPPTTRPHRPITFNLSSLKTPSPVASPPTPPAPRANRSFSSNAWPISRLARTTAPSSSAPSPAIFPPSASFAISPRRAISPKPPPSFSAPYARSTTTPASGKYTPCVSLKPDSVAPSTNAWNAPLLLGTSNHAPHLRREYQLPRTHPSLGRLRSCHPLFLSLHRGLSPQTPH